MFGLYHSFYSSYGRLVFLELASASIVTVQPYFELHFAPSLFSQGYISLPEMDWETGIASKDSKGSKDTITLEPNVELKLWQFISEVRTTTHAQEPSA